MQEKRVHIDDKFTNQAWAEMRNLLDRELPVAEPRRRGLAWWLACAVGLAVLAGGAAYWWFGTQAQKDKVGSALPIALSDKSQTGELPESQPRVNKGSAEEAPTSIVKKQALSPVSKPSSAQKMSSGRNGRKSLTPISMHQLATESDNLLAAHPATGQMPLEKTNIETTPLASTSVEPGTQTEILFNLPSGIPARDFQLIENQMLANKTVASALPWAKHWVWSLQGNGSAVTSLTGLGAGIEFGAERELSGRLSLRTGLGYDYLRQPIYAGVSVANTIGQADPSGKVFYDNPGLSAENIFDVTLNDVDTRFLKLHYLTMPLNLACTIGKRWEANLGGILGLLLTSSSVYVQDGLLDRAGFGTAADSSTSAKPAKVALSDFAITGGVGFKLNRTWSLQLRYVHGMTDVLPDNNAGDHNRLIKLGIRYNLNQGR